jgi:DNA-3-methyladenine glycosylase
VLVRAIEPLKGIDIMQQRTGKIKADNTLTKGPGNVGKALGIFKHHSGLHLLDDEVYLLDDEFTLEEHQIGTSGRIGVASAGADALLPYRFYVRGNKYVSGRNR